MVRRALGLAARGIQGKSFCCAALVAIGAAACSKAEPSALGPASVVPASHAPALAASADATDRPATGTPVAPVAPAAAAAPTLNDPGAACSERAGLTLFTSPRAPRPGAPLRVVAVGEEAHSGALTLYGAGGVELARSQERHGGPPYWWTVELPAASAGAYRAAWTSDQPGEARACRAVTVEGADAAPARWAPNWPIEGAWTRAAEGLYSAWIEKLFDAPLDQQPSWPALHEVLRDPARNFLHDHLGLGEDDAGPDALVVRPDCADLPYFLRAYFAFKLRLPFGYSRCSRGGPSSPPRCSAWRSQKDGLADLRGGPKRAFGAFLRTRLADAVHSGNGRVPSADDASDYYAVPLTPSALRPGTVYADPYGHLLVVTKRIEQTASSGGILLAVDGQPDATIARRRFWRGNFLFAHDPVLGSPGFKRFRPVVSEGGRLRALTHGEIQRSAEYGDASLEQDGLSVEAFYDRMDEVLSPRPLDPSRALLETIVALGEQVKGRVLSVDNGEAYKAKHRERIDMPEGRAIFETTGPWEDFATPSRDLRLLIALDIVRGFPERVRRNPQRYAAPTSTTPATAPLDLEAMLQRELAARSVQYRRSDGSTFTLTLADVLARAQNLEMAYNPNDCVEARWGAPEGTDERSTCRTRAPGDQRRRMTQVRAWFRDRKRPAR
jgi:hypothetical protein